MWKTSIVVVTIGALAACKKEPRNEGTSWLLLGLLAGSSCRPALLGGTMQSSFCSAQLTGEVLTFAGSPAGSSSSGDTDGTGTAARFNNPAGIATDGINLFVSDMANNKIRRIALPSGVVSTLAGPAAGCAGACPAGDTDASGTTARFQSPIGITSDGVYLYVSDFGNNKIRRISIASGAVATFAGPSQGTTTSGDADGGSSAARFSSPYGLATDGTDLFVSDFSSHKIRRISLANGTTSTLAGPGEMQEFRESVRRTSRLGGVDAEDLKRKIQQLMGEEVYCDETLTLKSLAERLDIRPDQLSEFINVTYGVGFRRWLNQKRVQRAGELLLEDREATILKVALDTGFGTKAAFNREFKSQTGMTPTEFRSHSAPSSDSGTSKG